MAPTPGPKAHHYLHLTTEKVTEAESHTNPLQRPKTSHLRQWFADKEELKWHWTSCNSRHLEARWNLGRHVEVYDTGLFGILQTTSYARRWITDSSNAGTNAIGIFVDNQAAIRRCTIPRPTAGQHLTRNLRHVLQNRNDIQINIRWVPGHTEVIGNETKDKCAKSAAELPNRCRYALTSLDYAKRQIQQKGLREWQYLWGTTSRGQEYCNIARKQLLWGSSWEPTAKLLRTDQTAASTIHQPRLGHGYFRDFLTRFPKYNSTLCQYLWRAQSVKNLLLGCRTYQREMSSRDR